jgi:aminoglycoside phosphotransferase (APT) family kinase protein
MAGDAEIKEQLARFVRVQVGADATIGPLTTLPGHAGLSYSFELEYGSPVRRERLRATMPQQTRVGCVHGDYQWSNTLADDGRVQIVIDWELAQIGATLIDLGWLLLFSDPSSWVVTSLVPTHIQSAEELAEEYRKQIPWSVSDGEIRWFRAFAGYRFGVITAFNLMLHRRGKRHDPTWEEIALSAPRLFERGRELIG